MHIHRRTTWSCYYKKMSLIKVQVGMFTRFLICVLFSHSIITSECAVFEDMENLHQYLTNKSRDIKPRINQSDSVNVDIFMSLSSIQDFDEISGTLTFTGCFTFMWNDEIKRWNPENYGGINVTKLPILKTWMPMLLLRNGIDVYSFYNYKNDMDIETAKTIYYAGGDAMFLVYGLLRVTCESDVTYYPFDEHKCTIAIMNSEFHDVATLSSIYGIYVDSLISNGEWYIKSKSEYVAKRSVFFRFLGAIETRNQIEFTIVISREYLFPFLNTMLPVFLLSLAHLLVFLLPIDSGERTSFSYTLLLTLVVFMTMVSDRLPPTNNISVFNMFLLSQLFSSILTTSLVVACIRLFYKQANASYQGLVYHMVLQLYKLSNKDSIKSRKVDNSEKDENITEITETITSQQVAVFFDKLCFWFLCVFCGLQFCIFQLVVIFRRTKFE